MLCSATAGADDWPVFRHDAERSGYTPDGIKAEQLQTAWVITSPQPPRPAWPGPARWDAYANIRGLRSMRNYDAAYQITIAGDSLFYGSSADDAVHCVDIQNGNERWTFTTDGPVRIAPSIYEGRVYFGSDDGHAYCVAAENGQLIWKSESIQEERFILNNGRFISHWPCRTGVVVANGTAWYGLSLLPWKLSYLVSVDAATGKPKTSEHYIRRLQNQTLEGGLLLHDEAIIALRGRVAPFLFNRHDGSDIGAIREGGGGVFATLDSAGNLLHGPGNKTGWITQTNPGNLTRTGTVKNQNAVVSLPARNIFLSDDAVTAINKETGDTTWQTYFRSAAEIIVAGDTVFVGGNDVVCALRVADGKQTWRAEVTGRVYGMAAAAGRLFVSTDQGSIHCFLPSDKDRLSKSNQSPDQNTNAPSENTDDRADVTATSDGLIGQWVFRTGMGELAKRRGLPNAERRVTNSAGRIDGTIAGPVQLREVGGVEALEMDGSTNSILLTDNLADAGLPRQAMTVEAWVRLDKPLRWGGIAGAFQDNGSFERGWTLGYQNSHFSFAVCGKDGPGRLSYLKGVTEFNSQRWYHVVGTYDGQLQQLFVNGELESVLSEQTGPIDYPAQAFFELGAYHDKDENFRMTGMLHEVRIYDRALDSAEIAQNYKAKKDRFPVPIELPGGPFATFTGPGRAEVKWSTTNPSPTAIELKGFGETRQFHDPVPKSRHSAVFNGLPRNRVGSYAITTTTNGKTRISQAFELDTSFNYSLPSMQGQPEFATTKGEAQSRAHRVLSATEVRKGICLVVGIRDGSVGFEIARQSDLNVMCVDTNPDRVRTARHVLSAAGVYGTRISVRHVESYAALPFPSRCVNLVVSERQLLDNEFVMNPGETFRILRPFGGTIHLNRKSQSDPAVASAVHQWQELAEASVSEIRHGDQQSIKVARLKLDGAGEWSHLYGRADNSAFGGETLSGASTVGELEVQWIGRPGPRAQPDRNGRKPSPLSKNGRLFVQGLHRLIGIDALNGTPLWSMEIPNLERFNMPRDCGNWCVDDDDVYVAVRDRCWRISAQGGTLLETHPVPGGRNKDWSYDWGYVARPGNLLLGSTVKRGTSYTNFWGNADAGWYDARSGPVTFKVCSEKLFAMEPASGEVRWDHSNGLIINSTITATADRTYFVECRHPAVMASSSRRVGMPELWQHQYLVALETRTGRVDWECPIDTADGIVVFNMAHSAGKLVINTSGAGRYNVYAFSANSGELLWEQEFGWPGDKGDHGKAMSRPAIVGNTVYVRPRTLDLETGRVLPLTMPGGGCGTYAATTNALFFRSQNITAWNTESGSTTSWNRLRPGCWLSTIPANGMLLSPEAGGGCSCGSWLETSIGFSPVRD